MKFVLCADETYTELYQRDSYKYVRLEDALDLRPYRDCIVLVHQDDCMGFDEVLEQVELLHDFGCVKVVYILDNEYPKKETPREKPEVYEDAPEQVTFLGDKI